MSHAIMRFKGWIIGFGSNEEDRAHVHVYRKGEPQIYSKLWLNKEVEIAHNKAHFTNTELKTIRNIVLANREMLLTSWYDHFNQ